MPIARGVSAAVIMLLVNVTPPARAEDAMMRGDTFGDWTLMTDSETPHRFCFVTAEPRPVSGNGGERESPHAYISAWPKDGIKGEVSFRMGFQTRKNADGTATVPPSSYKLFGAKDRAYVSDATQELKLLEAMRKGSTMTVTMSPDNGPAVTDTYSLNGVGFALQKLQSACF